MNMRKFWIYMNIFYERTMLIIFLLCLIIACYGLYDTWYIYNNANDDSYLKYKPVPGQSAKDTPITDEMVAWITIDDTNIDYPVMQGSDNTRFLNINPYGEYSLSGSIFLDSRNSPDFTDNYSILYGHHMEYGSMFGALDDFLQQSYLEEHRYGTLMIGKDGGKVLQLEVFAALNVNIYDTDILDPEYYEQLEETVRQKSSSFNENISKRNHILALSTCTEPVSTNRLIVLCYIDQDEE